jgi:hypothetical protein
MTKETYYAIRIGDPRYHSPYFMTLDGKAPALFVTRQAAHEAMPKQTSTKVVRVTVHDGRCSNAMAGRTCAGPKEKP